MPVDKMNVNSSQHCFAYFFAKYKKIRVTITIIEHSCQKSINGTKPQTNE